MSNNNYYANNNNQQHPAPVSPDDEDNNVTNPEALLRRLGEQASQQRLLGRRLPHNSSSSAVLMGLGAEGESLRLQQQQQHSNTMTTRPDLPFAMGIQPGCLLANPVAPFLMSYPSASAAFPGATSMLPLPPNPMASMDLAMLRATAAAVPSFSSLERRQNNNNDMGHHNSKFPESSSSAAAPQEQQPDLGGQQQHQHQQNPLLKQQQAISKAPPAPAALKPDDGDHPRSSSASADSVRQLVPAQQQPPSKMQQQRQPQHSAAAGPGAYLHLALSDVLESLPSSYSYHHLPPVAHHHREQPSSSCSTRLLAGLVGPHLQHLSSFAANNNNPFLASRADFWNESLKSAATKEQQSQSSTTTGTEAGAGSREAASVKRKKPTLRNLGADVMGTSSPNQQQSVHKGNQDQARHKRTKGTGSQERRAYNAESFAQKLFKMITDQETQGKKDAVEFLDQGGGFWLHNPSRVCELMPQYGFRGNKFSGFRRQLTSYGFSRERKAGPTKGAYINPKFCRGKPELCEQIIRDNRYDFTRGLDYSSNDEEEVDGDREKDSCESSSGISDSDNGTSVCRGGACPVTTGNNGKGT